MNIKTLILTVGIIILPLFDNSGTFGQENTDKLVVLVSTEIIGATIRPLFITKDFALVYESDIPADMKRIAPILPDKPGDYYIMRVASPNDLKPIEDNIPYY